MGRGGQIKVNRDHRQHYWDRNRYIVRRARRRLRDFVIALDRRVIARVRRSGVVPRFVEVRPATAYALAAGIPCASPLDSRLTVAIATDHHAAAGEQRIGQPEPDQAEPGESGIEAIAGHLGILEAAEYIGLIAVG